MIWTVVLRTQQKWIHQHFYSSSTPHSEIGPGNLLSHHSVTTLPLLLPIVLMCAKLISTCLHASRNKRCNLQAPWTLIYLVLLLLLPPHGCLSHFLRLSSGMRDQQEARGRIPSMLSPCCWQVSLKGLYNQPGLHDYSLHLSSLDWCCNILTK